MSTYEVKSDVTGSVWKILTRIGQRIDAGEPLMIIESMKMEIPVVIEDAGTLVELRVAEGQSVSEGQIVALVDI
ncbi:MAG: acetyl-CoA carboxylase biotin carboxyl carrier protein subunit [Candidimonas sp.]|nr:MAG: acetyl-CoA carboxylase biotin carboxyl carrier protein subunit [Candidimonas sp.]TAM20283.1 MAG: acetyl-CoA carboxylase biotin carboxyl carrier protein subunit [Candidimonas sp.]TAM79932.1 MAG: acetyl-CoA carboxylase biotin carboxyl carrier protein subunit [Candidimonas sp.]